MDNEKEKSEYEIQADSWLLKHKVNLTIEFLRNGKYFEGDKDSRDIYTFTLERNGSKYSGTYGNSIVNSGMYYLPRRLNGGSEFPLKTQEERPEGFSTRVNTTPWEKRKERLVPTAYDVLAALTKDNPGSFEEFCADFGYSADSKSAYRTYKMVVREWLGLSRVLNEAAIQDLTEIN